MTKALVYGFYGKGNLGDDLFMSAFKALWPEIDFKFVSRLTKKDVDSVDAVFFGGGSFLYTMPNVDDDVDLKGKKVYYVGVGAETDIHAFHALTMMNAGVVAIRTPEFIDKVKLVTTGRANVIGIPDIVFTVPKTSVAPKRKEKTILVIPNSELLPRTSDPHWKHVAWEHYKNEFAQVLDHFTREGYAVSFRSLCENAHMSDEWAATELVARMDGRRTRMAKAEALTSMAFAVLPYLLTSVVVTQRLHGAVLAEMTNTPYVIVHHHDKLKTFEPCRGVKHPYYESSKQSMIDAIKMAEQKHLTGDVVDIASFTELREKVRTHLAI